jgi:hypothetical protein
MPLLPRLIAAVCLFAIAPLAIGAPAEKESSYEIEVLVFENRLPDLIGDELLARDPDTLRLRALEIAIPPETPAAGEPYLKSVVAGELERAGQYRALAHAHWSQTLDPGGKATVKPVRIAPAGAANPPELEGAIRFYMSRYLHLDVNLLYRETGVAGVAPVYRISEQRRIKSQETHYFDHPRFGVLVRVMPLEKDKDRKP